MKGKAITTLLFTAILLLALASGCISEGKTVVTARVTIAESGGKPHITQLQAEKHTISALREYRDTPPHFPGITLRIIHNMRKIDYWRSIAYKGPGEYEITTELKTIPNQGETTKVIVELLNETGEVLDKKSTTLTWQ